MKNYPVLIFFMFQTINSIYAQSTYNNCVQTELKSLTKIHLSLQEYNNQFESNLNSKYGIIEFNFENSSYDTILSQLPPINENIIIYLNEITSY